MLEIPESTTIARQLNETVRVSCLIEGGTLIGGNTNNEISMRFAGRKRH